MSDLHSFFASINGLVSRKEGRRLASLLALPIDVSSLISSSSDKQLAERAQGVNCLTYASSNIVDDGVASIAGFRVLALISLVKSDYKKAYEHELAAYNSVLEYIKEDNSTWILPVLFRVSNDMRLLAIKVNRSAHVECTSDTFMLGGCGIEQERFPQKCSGEPNQGVHCHRQGQELYHDAWVEEDGNILCD